MTLQENKREEKQEKDMTEASVTYSLQTCGSVSFKPCQTFEEAPFFSAYKSPPYSLHLRNTHTHEHTSTVPGHTHCIHTPLQAADILADPL